MYLKKSVFATQLNLGKGYAAGTPQRQPLRALPAASLSMQWPRHNLNLNPIPGVQLDKCNLWEDKWVYVCDLEATCMKQAEAHME